MQFVLINDHFFAIFKTEHERQHETSNGTLHIDREG